MAAAIFVSVVAAIIASTVIITSLMKGEVANAISSNNAQLASSIQQASQSSSGMVAGNCTVPQNEEGYGSGEASSYQTTATSAGVRHHEPQYNVPQHSSYYGSGSYGKSHEESKKHQYKWSPEIRNSYNNTYHSETDNSKTVTNTTDKSKHYTSVKDSFNDNSTNIRDNEVNIGSNNNNHSNNTTDSYNKETNVTDSFNDNSTTKNTTNVTDSFNDNSKKTTNVNSHNKTTVKDSFNKTVKKSNEVTNNVKVNNKQVNQEPVKTEEL